MRLTALGFKTYAAYLRSPHWTKFKNSIRPKVCLCGETKNLALHHKTYIRLGAEKKSDVQWLCQHHHSHLHTLHKHGRANLDHYDHHPLPEDKLKRKSAPRGNKKRRIIKQQARGARRLGVPLDEFMVFRDASQKFQRIAQHEARVAADHKVKIRFDGKYRPVCSCGWTGELYDVEAHARHEADDLHPQP